MYRAQFIKKLKELIEKFDFSRAPGVSEMINDAFINPGSLSNEEIIRLVQIAITLTSSLPPLAPAPQPTVKTKKEKAK